MYGSREASGFKTVVRRGAQSAAQGRELVRLNVGTCVQAMPYTSRELTHFVGSKLRPNSEKQFELLVKILESGVLSPRPDNMPSWYNRFYGGPISLKGGEMYPQFCCVCMCDIPLGDLNIHIKKYGEFGLAFPKSFLVPKGATPVFYVAHNAPYIFSEQPLAERFVDMANRFQHFFDLAEFAPGAIPVELRNAWDFMLQQVLAYIKVFDSGASDDAKDNYYMEREWRLVGGFKFLIEDVSRTSHE